MLVRITNEVYINPDKVEMVILESISSDGVPHEEPFVVIGFQGGGGRKFSPDIKIEDVVAALGEYKSKISTLQRDVLINKLPEPEFSSQVMSAVVDSEMSENTDELEDGDYIEEPVTTRKFDKESIARFFKGTK